MMALMIGAPVLLVGMTAGLLIGLIQALTQVQDQTVSFVPKVIAMAAALAISLPWVLQKLIFYTDDLFSNIPHRIMGG